MRKFDHVGIPTQLKQEKEIHLADAGAFITDYTLSENKIEWLRFEEESIFPKLIQTTAHLAYQTENIEVELENANVLVEPFIGGNGKRIAFIEEEGAPIELMEI